MAATLTQEGRAPAAQEFTPAEFERFVKSCLRRVVHPGLGVGSRNVSSHSVFAARPSVVWAAAGTRSRLSRSHLYLPRFDAGASGT